MFRSLANGALKLASHQLGSRAVGIRYIQASTRSLVLCNQMEHMSLGKLNFLSSSKLICDRIQSQAISSQNFISVRGFHAKGSKIKYLDFRHKFSTCHLRSHLLIIRKQKMKKHRRMKWRKKYKCLLAKHRLKREISKEKTFRVELLTMIKRAEQFNPQEYALAKIREINSRPKELTREERLEELKELIRVNRYQVTYIKPKHKRAEFFHEDHRA